MKLTVLVLLLVAHLVASSRHCNPVIAYHGSDCTCESKLPYQVQAPEQKPSPVQFQSYAFAIHYPLVKKQHQHEPATYDVQVQQAGEKESQKKLTDIAYKIRTPKEKTEERNSPMRYQYNVQIPQLQQGHVHLKNLESCVDRWDLPRNCKCDGPCNCQGQHHHGLAPQESQDDSERNAMRYRRSTDSVEKMTAAKVKSIKPKKVKSHKATDDYFKNLQGDSYVLERIRQKRDTEAAAAPAWGLVGLAPPNLPNLALPQLDLDSINLQINKNMEALRNFQL